MSPHREFGRYCPIEMSDPSLESDHVRNLTFYSGALGGRGDVSLYVPPGVEHLRSVPMVLLLHGVYGSHWSWFGNGGAHRTALQLAQNGSIRPMLLLCPSDGLGGDGSGYVSSSAHDIESWICEDVPGCVRMLYPGATESSPLFIAGLSMGGFGALRLGAKRPALFRGIAAHSPITGIAQLNNSLREPLSPAETDEELEIVYWMKRHQEMLPPVRIDCGDSDHLFAADCELHEALRAAGIPHEFVIYKGEHTWAYWREHIVDTLLFFDSLLPPA